ncbi:MAG TPA: sugar phosphate isomerase/epimerase family protein [Melioribacteraceae bacterium]|nr:sugar phosphate isomerase/epimerase family protein [Melioribacteraceae bacterium]
MVDSRIVCCYLLPITKYGYPPNAENTIDYISEMHSLGFSSVEIEGIRETHLTKVFEMRFDIKKMIDEHNISIPYFCAVLPGLSSMDKKEREANLELFDKGCQVASVLGSKGILDNGPLPPYQFPKEIPVVRHYDEDSLRFAYLPDNFSWNKFWDQLVDTYKTLCDIAAGYKLEYQVHPAVGVISSSTDGFLCLARDVKKDNLKFNFDTANLFATKENLVLSFMKVKDFVSYIHISDNRGCKVEHLEIGAGLINWQKFFEVINNNGFDGHFGIDIGGEESGVKKLNVAYLSAAKYLEEKWLKKN